MEIVFIFLAILLLFGAKRIPEIARGMGHGIREFKDATSDIKRELASADSPARPQVPQPLQASGLQAQAQPAATTVAAPPAEGPAPGALV